MVAPPSLAAEIRAGVTTFMVMAYIIFVNPAVLGFAGIPDLEGRGLPFGPTLTVTCLTAGLLSIAMGTVSRYPFAMAPGMGLNAVVAFELVAGRGLTWPQAMTVVFLEGLVITLPVLTRFRQAVMDAVPLALKRAIGAGIGLFIAFIGFVPAGFVVTPASGPLPVGLGPRRGLADGSSNTTYIESAAGVAEGARTGVASVVTGLLFLLAMFFAPLAGVIPAQATAPALILVGFSMDLDRP